MIGIDYWVSTIGPAWDESYPVANRIADNRISSIYGSTIGIQVNGGKPQIHNNIVKDINMSVGDLTILSIYCIKILKAVSGSIINGNRFSNLTLSPQQASGITGIHVDNARGVEISGNLMHNFQVTPGMHTGWIAGIQTTSFVNRLNIINNMISLGVDSTGSPSFMVSEYNGIIATIDTTNIIHNSIYITGTSDRDANCLHLTKRNNSVCRVTNNILMNIHAQATTNNNSFNCAVKFDPIFNTTLNGLVMNYNLYQVSGLGSFVGSYNNIRHATLLAWRAATSQESNGLTGNPNFIRAAGDSLTTNMHIQLPTPADGQGLVEASVQVDYDNQLRSSLTPADIGADAISSGPPSPVITSFNPASAGAGIIITITGTNFTGATAVSFGGTAAASFTVVNATTITAVTGNGSSGSVSVTTAGGTATLPGFTFIPLPLISSFNPTSGGTGTTVTITGQHFTGSTAVSFGGTPASSFTVVNSTTITAVPGNGSSGSISVTTAGGTATMPGFTFIPPPAITSFNPTSGTAGTMVTITGLNFNAATAVSFGGTAASSFTILSPTSITAVLGTGTTGTVSVTTPYGVAISTGIFTYNVVTGIGNPQPSNSPDLVVSPNPSEDQIRISHPASAGVSRIRFFDMLGREVKLLIPAANSKETSTSVRYFIKGIYKITWTDGKRILKRNFLVR